MLFSVAIAIGITEVNLINNQSKDEPPGLLYVNRTKSDWFGVTLKQIHNWGNKTDLTFDWIAIGTLKESETTPENRMGLNENKEKVMLKLFN